MHMTMWIILALHESQQFSNAVVEYEVLVPSVEAVGD